MTQRRCQTRRHYVMREFKMGGDFRHTTMELKLRLISKLRKTLRSSNPPDQIE
jgi:hypothetical protein